MALFVDHLVARILYSFQVAHEFIDLGFPDSHEDRKFVQEIKKFGFMSLFYSFLRQVEVLPVECGEQDVCLTGHRSVTCAVRCQQSELTERCTSSKVSDKAEVRTVVILKLLVFNRESMIGHCFTIKGLEGLMENLGF